MKRLMSKYIPDHIYQELKSRNGNYDYSVKHGLGYYTVRGDERRLWDKIVCDFALDMFDTMTPDEIQYQQAEDKARPTLDMIFQRKAVENGR